MATNTRKAHGSSFEHVQSSFFHSLFATGILKLPNYEYVRWSRDFLCSHNFLSSGTITSCEEHLSAIEGGANREAGGAVRICSDGNLI